MKRILLFFVLFSSAAFSQRSVFWRSEAANGNWENGTCAEIGTVNSQWFYGGFGSNSSRNRPDCFDGSTTRHNVTIGNNVHKIMSVNNTFWGLRTLTLSSGASETRTFNSSPDDGTRGIGFTNGMYNESNTTHDFNVRISVDASLVYLKATSASAVNNFNREIFVNGNTIVFQGSGNNNVTAAISGVGGKLKKEESGTTTLSGNLTYNGVTTVSGGILKVQKGGHTADISLNAIHFTFASPSQAAGIYDFLPGQLGGNTSRTLTSNLLGKTVTFDYNSGDVTICDNVGTPSTPTPSATSICQASAPTAYTTSATNATSYTWSVTGTGNTISGIGTTGTVTWAAGFTGSATVSVVANGCNGTSSSASTTVNVIANATWYRDFDNDTYGDALTSTTNCTQPVGYVANSLDCDDTRSFVYPGAPDICYNNIKEDCNDADIYGGCATPLVYITNYCGQTLPFLNASINCTTAVVPQGNTFQYRFRVKRVGGAEDIIYRDVPNFNLTQTSVYAYSATFEVYASVRVNGIEDQPESSVCTISTPAVAPAALQTTFCSNTLATASTPIFAAPIQGATGYQFEVYSGATLVGVVTRSVPYFYLTNLASWNYATVYTVRVAVKINQEVFGSYGASCTVTTPAIPATGLSNCGAPMATVSSPIFTPLVLGAVEYQFEVSLGATTYPLITRSVPYFYLTSIADWRYGATYTVRVRARRNNESYGPFSDGCLLTTPTMPTTQVRAIQCGNTNVNPSTPIFTDLVFGATSYQFTVEDGTNAPQVFERSVNYFSLNSIATWQYDTSYTVSVKVKRNSGDYGAAGDICTLSTPVGPVTTISDANCNNPLLNKSTGVLVCDAYPNASAYEFIIEEYDGNTLVNTYTRVRFTNSISLASIPELEAGVTYNWGVRVAVMGRYGVGEARCNFTVASARMIEAEFGAKVYPNPFANNFMIDVTTDSKSAVSIKVYDMVGRLVEEQLVQVTDLKTSTLGDRYPSGVYNVVITQDEAVQTLRVVKR